MRKAEGLNVRRARVKETEQASKCEWTPEQAGISREVGMWGHCEVKVRERRGVLITCYIIQRPSPRRPAVRSCWSVFLDGTISSITEIGIEYV